MFLAMLKLEALWNNELRVDDASESNALSPPLLDLLILSERNITTLMCGFKHAGFLE